MGGLSPGVVQGGAYAALASVTNVTAVDLSLSNNFALLMTENTTLAVPTNAVPGQSGAIQITEDAGTGYTLAYSAFWKWAGGAPVAPSVALSAISALCYLVDSSGLFATCTMNLDIA